jgi:dTDP-4-amino-4,6-dideoxygalactose transaminase
MDSVQAAVLSVKLKFLDHWVSRRQEIATTYLKELANLRWLHLPVVPDDGRHAWHQFAIKAPDRNSLRHHLSDEGIPTGIHYPQSLPEFSFHADAVGADYPQAASLAEHELSLPIGEHLTDNEVDHVIHALGSYSPRE